MDTIQAKEFSRRRKELMGMMASNSIAIIPAAPVQVRNRDVDQVFRQDSDFHYLCAFPEPEAVLVMVPGREHGECILFCRERDVEMELWHGYRLGQEGALELYGMDDAFPIGDIDEIIEGLIEGKEQLYCTMGSYADFDSKLLSWVNSIKSKVGRGDHPPSEFVALDHLLHDMRLIKSEFEQKRMREAAHIASAGHLRAMQFCQPGFYEYQLDAELCYEFSRSGSRRLAYPSIVGGGRNGCVLHYTENNDPLLDGDLVLVDAGCEYDYYASDITRTYPINGRYSAEQRALYDITLAAQYAAIAEVKPGNNWQAPHQAAVRIITQGLLDLGLLQGELEKLLKDETYKAFYMHRTGHWLGMDVHDVGDYKIADTWRELEAGMVLTVEPGIYVSPSNQDVEERWRGIGIRIEDDVLVTAKGHEVLSSQAPKDPDEIEALMAQAQQERETARTAT